jgi:hypothetical protein
MRWIYAALLFVTLAGASVAGAQTEEAPPHRIGLRPSGESDRFEEPSERGLFEFLLRPFRGGDTFSGEARAAAKTSLVNRPIEQFESIGALHDALFVDDDDMRDGRLQGEEDRIEVERHMVRVEAMLIAIAREDDNDYHLIVADRGCRSAHCRLNVEISGLPRRNAADYDVLKHVRDRFEASLDRPIGEEYYYLDPGPEPVLLQGALFYDIDHAPGAVGPHDHAPDTAWEIHPLSRFEFLE